MPSTEEIEAGQKAYQRIKAFVRYKTTARTWVVILIWSGFFEYAAIRNGDLGVGLLWGILVGASFWQWQRQKDRYQKDYQFLRELKTKYGSEVYVEIKKEPSSLYYRVFQKSYPPGRNRGPVLLP